jgi:hypothetical protein
MIQSNSYTINDSFVCIIFINADYKDESDLGSSHAYCFSHNWI